MNQIKQLLESKGISNLFAYSRKSRDIDAEGLQKHHDIINEMAEKLGLPVEFYEEVESSETLNRIQLNQLRKDIQSKKVRCLIVYRMDRLSRKVTDTERLVKEFAFNDLILIEAHREKIVDYNEILGIKLEAMMSDLYQEQAKIVLASGRKKAVQLYGNHLGETPLGYDYNKETKKLVPNQDAWVVKKMFDMYLQGYSTHSIAIKLNEMGLRTKRGGIFKGKGIWQLLMNDKYIGVQTYGKKEWYKDGDGKVHCKDRPQEDWVVYRDAHEPIIDEETFEKVQQKIADNRVVPKGTKRHTSQLTGLVKCGKCGWNMAVIKRKYPNKEVVNIRSCYRRDYVKGGSCGNKGIDGETLDKFMIHEIFNNVRPVVLDMQKNLAKGNKSMKKVLNGQELDDLLKQERKLNQQMDKLIDMQLEFSTERVAIKMKQVEAQLLIIQDKIAQLKGEATVDETSWVDTFLKEAEDLVGFPFNYKGMTAEEKNIFLKKYIDHVTVLDGQITEIKFVDEVEKLIELCNKCYRNENENAL
jgi:DNA invertase Pin-like site-specific DNA recombinase